MKIKNKYRFWLGVSIFGIEVGVAAIWGLSKLDWNWINVQLAKYVFIGFSILLVNLIAFWLVKDGSEEKPAVKSRSYSMKNTKRKRKDR
jgi:hypothetical protein